MAINIITVLAALRRFLGFEMTIAEWIGTAILLAVPYLVVGVLWSATHTDQSLVASIVSWPVLLFSDVCTT